MARYRPGRSAWGDRVGLMVVIAGLCNHRLTIIYYLRRTILAQSATRRYAWCGSSASWDSPFREVADSSQQEVCAVHLGMVVDQLVAMAREGLLEGKTQSAEIGDLSRCSKYSTFSSPHWQGSFATSTTFWSRTCSCGTNSRSRSVPVLVLSSRPRIASSGCRSGAFTSTGKGISSWCDRKPSSAGTAKAGVSTGAGAQATTLVGLD